MFVLVFSTLKRGYLILPSTAHATKVPGLIFLSGQTPITKFGKLAEGGIKEHTVRGPNHYTAQINSQSMQAQCINNLEEVLTAAGSSWDKVLKVNIYLKNMDQFAEMNEVYEKVRVSLISQVDRRMLMDIFRCSRPPSLPELASRPASCPSTLMSRWRPLPLIDYPLTPRNQCCRL